MLYCLFSSLELEAFDLSNRFRFQCCLSLSVLYNYCISLHISISIKSYQVISQSVYYKLQLPIVPNQTHPIIEYYMLAGAAPHWYSKQIGLEMVNCEVTGF